MADKVSIKNLEEVAEEVGKSVRYYLERDHGKLDSIEDHLENVDGRLDDIDERLRGLEGLDKEIKELRQRIEHIEKTKAKAEREALEELKSELDRQFQEKKVEYERRLGEVLDDYRNSVETLKERFVDTISGREEQFSQVESEFNDALQGRQECINRTQQSGKVMTQNYDDRLESVIQSRNAFINSINDFVEDRDKTAATIDSLQTSVSGINGSAQVVVPFWVVGIEIDGREELRVLPIQNRGDTSERVDRGSPYVEYLQEHPTHSYGDLTDAVYEYVVRDEVRDNLANREHTFADPSFLQQDGLAMERFVDALIEFELSERETNGAQSGVGSTEESESVGRERLDRQEVPADG